MLSVIIPANNEGEYIGACFDALLAQEGDRLESVEIVVAANACTDDTIAVSDSYSERIAARGWHLNVLDITEPGKVNALNEADRSARGDIRVYLDADIICSRMVLSEIKAALERPEPTYASGQLVVAPAKSWITRRYADLWKRLPFMTSSGVTGAGLFAVNEQGRRRWSTFPNIISDDTYVRLLFRPGERIGVPATYLWPMVEGFNALVRVRRRQDAGVQELRENYPHLMANECKPVVRPIDHVRLFASVPLSYVVYVAVSVVVRVTHHTRDRDWSRGR